MPDTINHLDPPPAPPAPADEDGGLIPLDLAVRLNALGVLDLRRGNGELEAYRGEYVVAAPDGTILGHDRRLKQAEVQAAPEAAARGIPPSQLTWQYIPTLD
jgi:hypothetical protein